jgi:unspecific monooxygenase
MQTSVAPESIRTFIPPHPDPAPENLSPRQLASLMRTNNIRVWLQRAYEEEVVLRRFFGRSSVLFNAPKQFAMFWWITRRPMAEPAPSA